MNPLILRGDIVYYLPLQGGALLVYYHGAIPVDYYYLVNRVLLLKEVMVRSVVDKFLFKVCYSLQESKSAEN